MKYKISLIVTLLFTSPIQAEATVTTCAYKGGMARQIQELRQVEADDWAQFEQRINEIYKEGEGRDNLLEVAKNVYTHPVDISPDEVYENIFAVCRQ
ncbi:MAG: hypothetical protein ACKE9I_05210 [Methylophagaceae bacterium]